MGLLDTLSAFAEGYVGERGFVGTVEDVLGVASNLFGDDDSSNNNNYNNSYNNNNSSSDYYFNSPTYLEAQDEWWKLSNNGDSPKALKRLKRYYDEELCSEYDCNAYYVTAQIFQNWYRGLACDDDNVSVIEDKFWRALSEAKRLAYAGGNEQSMSALSELESQFRTDVEWKQMLNGFYDDVNTAKNEHSVDIFARAKKRVYDYYSRHSFTKDCRFYYLLTTLYSWWLWTAVSDYKDTYDEILASCEESLSLLRQNDMDNIYAKNIPKFIENLKNVKQRHLEDTTTATKIQESSTDALNDNEQKYLDEVKFCLEEDETITEVERKILERARIKLNISKERADEIEAMVKPQMNQNELDYLELFRSMKEDGEISERQRHILERKQQAWEISSERAAELEKMA